MELYKAVHSVIMKSAAENHTQTNVVIPSYNLDVIIKQLRIAGFQVVKTHPIYHTIYWDCDFDDSIASRLYRQIVNKKEREEQERKRLENQQEKKRKKELKKELKLEETSLLSLVNELNWNLE